MSKPRKERTRKSQTASLALAPRSACPECGFRNSSDLPMEQHSSIVECDRCGHPRDATLDEVKSFLRKRGYDPDALVRNIVRYVKSLKLDRPNVKDEPRRQ